jgi:3-phenylpropionate/trans-cinnamate dioxygenase ferredoxin reductase component
MRDDVVIIGGGQAALSCAVRLRESGHEGEIAIVGEERWLPYQRPPLSKTFLVGKMDIDRLSLRPQEFFEKSRILVHTGQRVIRIDRSRQEVELSGGGRLGYAKLVMATGSRARTLPNDSTKDLAGLLTLRTIDDAEVLRQALIDASRVLVIGAGYIGLEVAAISAGMGHQVTVVEIADRILNRVACAQTAQVVADLHMGHGVKLITRIGLDRFSASGGRVTGALLTDGSEIPADLVVVGIGGAANDELAAASGLAVANGIVVDRFCQTSDPNILAAGDCAIFPFEGRMVRLESVQNAIDQGIAVANVIAGKPAEYKPVPWFWSDQYDAKLQSVGLPFDYDQVIALRTARADGSAFCYVRAGHAIAVDTINDAKTHMAARRMFGSNGRLPAELLLNPQFDLIQHVRTGLQEASAVH